MKKMANEIARIENSFIEYARYKLSTREQKVILYLVANTDPYTEAFTENIIPVKELESILKKDGKKWGGIYEEMENFCSRVSKQQITFPSNVVINGRRMKGYLNWFQSVHPIQLENGEVCIRFLFSTDLKHFFLNLREYARINHTEIAQMRSRHSIRLFQIFKAAKEKQRKHKSIVTVTYELNELKEILGLYDENKKCFKYKEFRDFKKNVLIPAEKEINSQTSIYFEIQYKRNSRSKITHLEFQLYDNNSKYIESLSLNKKRQLYTSILGEKQNYETINISKFKRTFAHKYNEIILAVENKIIDFEHSLGKPLKDKTNMTKQHIASECVLYINNELNKLKQLEISFK